MKVPLTPLRFLERAAAVHPDRTAIIDGPRSLSYRDMAAQVNRLAQALRARGIRPGDRVAYLTPNSAELLMAHFAVPLSGGVLVTLNTRLSPAEIARIFEHSGAEILIGDAPLLEPALEGLSAARSLRSIVTVPAESGDPVQLPGARVYDELLAVGSDEPLAFTVPDEDRPISLNYTSGTTGDPKGVVYTHRGASLNSLGVVIHQGFAGAIRDELNIRVLHGYGLTETYGPYTVCEEQESWSALPDEERAALTARQGVGMVTAEDVRVVATKGDPDRLTDVPADGVTIGEIVMRGNTLKSHPAVADAAVIGVPDKIWGERPKALSCSPPAGRSARPT